MLYERLCAHYLRCVLDYNAQIIMIFFEMAPNIYK